MSEIIPPEVEVIITVAEDKKASLNQIVSELRSRGLDMTGEPLENLGMIAGKAAARDLDQLRSVSGVTAVEPAETVHVPPPESDIQ